MKQFLLFTAFMLLATASLKATTWTVSNDPVTPAQYSDLQTCVDNAGPGDTILVYPSRLNGTSPVDYGSIDISIPLVLIGGGAWFDNGLTTSSEKKTTYVSTISLKQNSSALSASGTKIYGLSIHTLNFNAGFTGSTYTTGGLNSILVENCKISSVNFTRNASYVEKTFKNDTIRNCIITNNIHLENTKNYSFNGSNKFNNVYITNNIFDGSTITAYIDNTVNTNYLDSVYVRNNIFINRTSNTFDKVPHLVVENNIFFGAEPSVASTPSGVTFNNNITYNTTASLPGTGNVGSGNLNATFPKFENYNISSGAFQCGQDFSLQSGSPALNAGTDGSDIGLTGGMSPFYDYCSGPKVPTIILLSLPDNGSSVPQGGNLNVTFKAKNKD